MKRLIKIEWEIRDTRDINGSYRIGKSNLVVNTKKLSDAITQAIEFASNLPSWELERNGIDKKKYKDEVYCRYHYQTQISKIISIEKYKGE